MLELEQQQREATREMRALLDITDTRAPDTIEIPLGPLRKLFTTPRAALLGAAPAGDWTAEDTLRITYFTLRQEEMNQVDGGESVGGFRGEIVYVIEWFDAVG